MPTIKDVAELAGVSVGTVSHVIAGGARVSEATRARVEEAIRRLGYRPNPIARSLKSRRSRMIGMVISDITNPFFSEVVRGAEDAVLQRGYFLATYNTDDELEREQRLFELFESWRADGMLVVTAAERGPRPHLERAVKEGRAIVCLDRRPGELRVDSVTVNNAEAVEEAILYMAALGYRRIAFVGGTRGMYVASDRLRGYRRAMKRLGLRPVDYPGDFRVAGARQAALRALSADPRPEAVFAANNLTAAGVLQAMRELGLRCPQNVALATFDCVELLQSFGLQLTCVAQPTYQIGSEAAHLLMDRVEGKIDSSKPRHIVLRCELRPGESTPPRRAGVSPNAGKDESGRERRGA
jgi:LacI family transcriptional regulator